MITLMLALALQDEAAQAAKIVEKCWEAARPSVEKLGGKDAREPYLKSAAGLEKSLAGLPKETRDKIEAAADPLAALEEHKQRAPSIRDLLPRPPEPAKLKDGEGTATLEKVVGTWKNDWKAARIVTTWTIAADGAVEEEVARGDKVTKNSIKVAFTHVLRAAVTRGTTTQHHTFMLVGDCFYMSSNLLYDIHKVADRKRFAIPSEWDWLVAEDGTMTVIAESGASAKAEATWTTVDGVETLKLKWRFAGRKYDGTRAYVAVGEYLVHSGVQAFKKQ